LPCSLFPVEGALRAGGRGRREAWGRALRAQPPWRRLRQEEGLKERGSYLGGTRVGEPGAKGLQGGTPVAEHRIAGKIAFSRYFGGAHAQNETIQEEVRFRGREPS